MASGAKEDAVPTHLEAAAFGANVLNPRWLANSCLGVSEHEINPLGDRINGKQAPGGQMREDVITRRDCGGYVPPGERVSIAIVQ